MKLKMLRNTIGAFFSINHTHSLSYSYYQMNNIGSFFFKWISLIACILTFSSCAEDRINSDLNNDTADFENLVSVVLNAQIDYPIKSSGFQPSTQKAEIAVWQNTDKFHQTFDTKSSEDIRGLMLLQYDNTGRLIHSLNIGNLSSLTNIPITLVKGLDFTIILISNANEIDWNDRSKYNTLNQIQKLQYDYTSITNDVEVPLIGSINVAS
ncbi:MAG: hypothetical protein ACRDCN_07255, partial [Tannerellaceae bacterium]